MRGCVEDGFIGLGGHQNRIIFLQQVPPSMAIAIHAGGCSGFC
jgi:hypothetical protein